MTLSAQLNDENLTLEEKLKLIDDMVKNTEVENKKRVNAGIAPADPMDDLQCQSCQ